MALSRRWRWRWRAGASAAALLVCAVLVTRSVAASKPAHHQGKVLSWAAEKRALVGELAILRRPQTKSDLDAALLERPIFGRLQADLALMRRATSASGQHVYLVPVRHPRQAGGGATGLMVFALDGGGCCATAANIRKQGTWESTGPPNRLLFVVPDGVATLRVTLRTGPDSAHPPTIGGKVQDNVIVLATPFAVETLSGDPVTWYGPRGHVVKRFVD